MPTLFSWLIESPGPRYLAARQIGHFPEFHWTGDANDALAFRDKVQADCTMMAIRRMDEHLFAFETTLGNAVVRQHGFVAFPPEA